MFGGIKARLAHWYLRCLDLLHAPYRKNSANDPFHQVFIQFQQMVNASQDAAILEIGSRNVSGLLRRQFFPTCKDYVGFDIHAGEGVDIVGDAHRLSDYFPQERFDYVYSISVFEHLLFPWKVGLEINSVLKTGGCVLVTTHPAWPAHELPWDFWRFQQNSFRALFNRYTGFEIVELSEGLPCQMYSRVKDWPTRHIIHHPTNLGVAAIARKTGPYRRDLLRWELSCDDVLDSMYPARKSA